MTIVRLKIDVSGTVGDEAWHELHHFDEILSADFGPQFGSGGRCNHALDAPHAKGVRRSSHRWTGNLKCLRNSSANA